MILKDRKPNCSDPQKDLAVLESITPDSICVEIGVFKGEFSEEIVKKGPRHLYLVDPWKTWNGPGFRLYSKKQAVMDEIHESVVEKFQGDDNVTVRRLPSLEAVSGFEDDSLDWVYVDGDHGFQPCLDDLKAWYPKCKKGGLLVVDDYSQRDWPSVIRAVDKFSKDMKLPFKKVGKGRATQAVFEKI